MNKQNFRPEARSYALNVAIQSTDTLLSIIEEAYLAGVARESLHTQPPMATFVAPDVQLQHDSDLSPEILLPIMHRFGDVPCHRIAFYHVGKVDPNAKADLSKLRTFPIRAIPSPVDVPRCGSCGKGIDPYTTQDLDWKEHFVNPVAVRPHLIPLTNPTGASTRAGTPFEPGADSPSLSGESTGRTPVEDTAPVDVQPSAQPENTLDHLHQLATSLFDARSTNTPLPPIRTGPLPPDPTPTLPTTPENDDDVSSVG